MLYLGLDVHSKWMTAKGFEPELGSEVELIRLPNDSESLENKKLAVKMYRGELVALYVPDVKTQDQRALARTSTNASRYVTKLVNEIGSLLRSWGIILDRSLLSLKGQNLPESSRQRLPEHSQRVLDMWLEMLEMAKRSEEKLQEAVEEEVREDDQCVAKR